MGGWFLGTALLVAVGLNCIEAPLEPLAPTSDISLSIPLADVTKFASEFFNDTNTVKRAGDGSLFFSQTNTGAPTKLDTIKVLPLARSNQVSVGVIAVDPVPTSSDTLQVLPHLKNTDFPFPLNTIPLPAGDTTVPGFALPSFTDQFGFLAISSGSLNLSITNSTPATIKFPNGITLRNDTVDTNPVAVFVLTPDSIAPGQSSNTQVSLAGKIMRGKLKLDSLRLTTSQIDTPYDIGASNDHIVFGFGSTALVVDSAQSVIPQQTIASIDTSGIVIDDSVNVVDAQFRTGQFTAKIVNNLGINVGVFLKFGNFVSTASTDTFTIQKSLPGHDSLVVDVNMDTIRIVNGAVASKGTTMKFSVGIKTITSAGVKKTVSRNDFVRAEFLPTQAFSVKTITGKIKPTPLPVLTKTAGPDLGALSRTFHADSLKFDSIQIAVNLGLTGGFPTAYNLKFVAKSSKLNKLDTLPIPGNSFDPGQNGDQIKTITLDNSTGLNAFLSKFYPNFPDSFFVVGSATVNPGFVQRTISDTAKLTTSVSVYFPVKVGLTAGRVVTTTALDAASFPKDFSKDVKTAGVNFQFTNRLPFQIGFTMKLVGDTGAAGRDTLLIISPGVVGGAAVDPNGNAITPNVSNISTSLSGAQMGMFNLADSVRMEFNMQTSGSTTAQPVKVRLQDYVRVRASGKLVYTLKGGK